MHTLLLVAATPLETAILREQLAFEQITPDLWEKTVGHTRVHLLHTGIGMVNTAFSLGQYLARHSARMAVNFGIAGSFDKHLEIGQVVEIVVDSFSELGAESPEGFLDLQQIGFPLLKTASKIYFNTLPNPKNDAASVPQVRGITVNKVHGIEAHIRETLSQWPCQVESMEGAAFFHAMLSAEVRFRAYRAISNYVEKRDKSKWNIPLAAKTVQLFVAQQLPQIIERLPYSY